MQHVLLCEVRYYKTGYHHIRQRQREQELPAEGHQLVIAEARQRATDPDVNKDKEDDFRNKPENRQKCLDDGRQRDRRRDVERGMPSAEEKRRRDARDGEHIAVLSNKEDGKLHRAVFGVVSGYELGL